MISWWLLKMLAALNKIVWNVTSKIGAKSSHSKNSGFRTVQQ